MTYLQFHLVLMLPAILLLAVTQLSVLKKNAKRICYAIGFQILAALVYTTPWDNYLVYKGIWVYGADRIIGTIGYVPIEEYLFFILQPILSGLLAVRFCRNENLSLPMPRLFQNMPLVLLLGFVSVVGCAFLFFDRTLYLGLIVAWATPVIAFHWAIGSSILQKLARPVWSSIAITTVYLWLCDFSALRLGIWSISTDYTVGWGHPHLPFEEALFFFVTNVLVIQGVVLFLYDEGLSPFERWLGKVEPFRV